MKFNPNKVHPKDWKHVGIEPDPDFNPAHNAEVIERTIKAAEAMRRQKRREFQEGLAERTDALSKYLTSLEQGGGESDVSKYFGRKMKAELAGKYAMERIKDGLTSLDGKGDILRRPGETIEA